MTSPAIEVGNTILQQLGGAGKLKVMIGAKNFAALASTDKVKGGLVFGLPAFGKPRVNKIEVVLNGKDLYDVNFMFLRKHHGTVFPHQVASAHDVYADQLKSVIEKNTGLHLSL